MIRFIKYDGRQQRVVSIPRWAIGLGVVAAFLVGLMVLTLAAGIALVAIPTLLVAGGVAAWIGRGKALSGGRGVVPRDEASRDPFRRGPSQPRARGEEIVDVEYRIIDKDDEKK
jgi:hypothetical protein